jgi:hypothetical protein
MVVGGFAVLAIVRPWRPDPEEDGEREHGVAALPVARPKSLRPRPGAASPVSHGPKRHRIEVISRTRRVPSEPGREEILLPEWLGPVSGPR